MGFISKHYLLIIFFRFWLTHNSVELLIIRNIGWLMITWRHQQLITGRHSQLIAWRHSQLIAWRHPQLIAWRHSQLIAWRHQQLVAWRHSQLVAWRYPQLISWRHQLLFVGTRHYLATFDNLLARLLFAGFAEEIETGFKNRRNCLFFLPQLTARVCYDSDTVDTVYWGKWLCLYRRYSTM